MQRLYPDRVAVRYVDLRDPDLAAYPEALALYHAREAAMPFAYLDGELVSTGIDPWDRLMDRIDRALAPAPDSDKN